MNKRVLVIAAHPDDELLGCGGTVAKHVKNGDEVYALIVCEGESLRYTGMNVHQHSDTEKAAETIGFKKVFRIDLPDQKLDTLSLVDIITPMEHVVCEVKPNIAYVQFGGDLNRDHQLVFDAALVALRPNNEFIEEVMAFYTVGSTELGVRNAFIPDTWINIDNELETKIKAFSCYESEVRNYPHPRSLDGLRNLAHFCGNQSNMDSAESFMTIRRRIK